MSGEDIRTVVLYCTDVMVDDTGAVVRLMPQLIGELSAVVNVTAMCGNEAQAQRVRRAYAGVVKTVTIGSDSGSGEGSVLEELVHRETLNGTSTLFVDHNPKRCMRAVRMGIPAGVFVDAPRLYRDLGLWGILPLNHSLHDVEAHLTGLGAAQADPGAERK